MDPARFDPTRRYVRIVEERPDGMVEFEFAVGEPELFVEMMLPRAAFQDFCGDQGVIAAEVSSIAPSADDSDRADRPWAWTLHDARRLPPSSAPSSESDTAAPKTD